MRACMPVQSDVREGTGMASSASELAPLLRNRATPLPALRVAILLVVFLADSICLSVVLPIVPFMVQHFFQYDGAEQSHIGYLSGWVCAAYTLGQLVGAPFWGSLSDRIGRRPVILCGMLGNAAGMLAFGLAPSFGFAVGARLVQGLASGNVPVARSYMADITDSSNEARAFAMIGAVFGAGGMVGPVIGGLLSEPAIHFPAAFPPDSIFARKPFFLPCLVVASFVLLDLIFALLYLKESHPPRAQEQEQEQEQEQQIDEQSKSKHHNEESSFAATRRQLLSNRSFRAICCVFFIFGITFISMMEVFPIWARDPALLGGPAWQEQTVGLVQGLACIGTLVASLGLYAPLSKALGQERIFVVGLICNIFGFPWPAILTSAGVQTQRGAVFGLIVTQFFNAMGYEFCFTSANLMIKNTVETRFIGTAMGLGNTAVACGICIGPVMAASLFAYSVSPSLSHVPVVSMGRLFFFCAEALLLCNLYIAWRWLVVPAKKRKAMQTSTPLGSINST